MQRINRNPYKDLTGRVNDCLVPIYRPGAGKPFTVSALIMTTFLTQHKTKK